MEFQKLLQIEENNPFMNIEKAHTHYQKLLKNIKNYYIYIVLQMF